MPKNKTVAKQKPKKNKLLLPNYLIYLFIGILILLGISFNRENLISIKKTLVPQPIVAPLPTYETININPFQNESNFTLPFAMPDIVQPIFPERACNIADYGAVADATTKNTQAIANAIADCAKNGGGHVLIPKGAWLTGAVHLESNIDLHLNQGAVLIFSADPNDYLPVVLSRYEGIDVYNYSPLIYANGKQNIAVTGNGRILGNGQAWLDFNNVAITHTLYDMGDKNVPIKNRVFGSAEKMLRPAFIEFINSNSILLEDFSIENGPMWTVHPTYSQNIIIRNISILTTGKNNDGIDVDSSKNVLIEDSRLNTNDDSIALKSGKARDGLKVNRATENIIIRNNVISNGHGGIAIGSEIAGGVQNVFMYNCSIIGNQYGIRLKGLENESVWANNLWFQNIKMDKLLFNTIQMTMHYGSDQASGNTGAPVFQNIHFSNIVSPHSHESIEIDALENSPVEDVTIENSRLAAGAGVDLQNVNNFSLKTTTIQSKEAPIFTITNSRNVLLENPSCPLATKICAAVNGAATQNIQLPSKNPTTLQKKVQLSPEVSSDQVSF